MTTNIQDWIKCAKEVERMRDVRFDCSAEREAALDALDALVQSSFILPKASAQAAASADQPYSSQPSPAVSKP